MDQQTTALREAYDRDGFVLVDDVFTADEVGQLVAQVEQDERVTESVLVLDDEQGRQTKLALWYEIPDDAFGRAATHPAIASTAAALLGEEPLHYHTKVMLKHPREGGAWEWHQDYGYWYGVGFLFPRLLSAMIALDDATSENGCLKVLVGSHKLDRLDHSREHGGQAGVDPRRLAEVEARMPVRAIEAKAGSVLFFHCNLLHASDANLSSHPRRALICAYTGASNLPFGDVAFPTPQRLSATTGGPQ